MPARSTCSKMPGMRMSSPSNTASTSTSRPRRYLSTSSGAPGDRAAPTRRTTRAAPRYRRSPCRGRPERTRAAPSTGKPSSRAIARASRNVLAARPCGRATPRRASAASNCSRFSAMSSDAPVAPDDARTPRAAQLAGEIDRRLAAEREHDAARVRRAIRGLDFVGARRLEDQRRRRCRSRSKRSRDCC